MPTECTTTTITIDLMNGSSTYEATQVSASNVGELREELGLNGKISVDQVIAHDTTELKESSVVAHISANKSGGQ
jgi:hypothetical protein